MLVCQEMSQELDILGPIDGALSLIYSYIHLFTLYQGPTMSHAYMQGIGHDGGMIISLKNCCSSEAVLQ